MTFFTNAKDYYLVKLDRLQTELHIQAIFEHFLCQNLENKCSNIWSSYRKEIMDQSERILTRYLWLFYNSFVFDVTETKIEQYSCYFHHFFSVLRYLLYKISKSCRLFWPHWSLSDLFSGMSNWLKFFFVYFLHSFEHNNQKINRLWIFILFIVSHHQKKINNVSY